MRRRDDRQFALTIALGIVCSGAIISMLSVAGMRMAYRRAYAEVAAHCRRVTLLTVDDVRYFCAPVARVDASPAAPDSPRSGAQL